MDAIINVIAKQLGAVCLPRPLVRKADGTVGCNVVWELPKAGTAPATTPTVCEGTPYLQPVTGGRSPTNDRGGVNCRVNQLAVADTSTKIGPTGDGWFYDTFTDELERQCNKAQPQRIAFSSTAIILKVVDLLIGARVSPEVETQGLDLSEHGERGYVYEN